MGMASSSTVFIVAQCTICIKIARRRFTSQMPEERKKKVLIDYSVRVLLVASIKIRKNLSENGS